MEQDDNWIRTLLYSWGSETPVEVIWGLNEMVKWLNEKHRFQLNELYEPFSDEYESEGYNEEERVGAIVQALNQLRRE